MTLQLTKPISMADIEAEFGAPPGTPLSAFVRGGAFVPESPVNAGVPTAKPIAMTDLLGAESVPVFPQVGLLLQTDVNTRGRTDNVPFDHISGLLPLATTGVPTLAAPGAGGFDANGFDGPGEASFTLNNPAGPGPMAFVEVPFTVAFRFRWPSAVGSANFGLAWRWDNGLGRSRVDHTFRSGGGMIIAYENDEEQSSMTIGVAFDDGLEHVGVYRLTEGNTPNGEPKTDFYVDGIFIDDDLNTTGMSEPLGVTVLKVGGSSGGTARYDLFWYAIYDNAISVAELQLLDDQPNPYTTIS